MSNVIPQNLDNIIVKDNKQQLCEDTGGIFINDKIVNNIIKGIVILIILYLIFSQLFQCEGYGNKIEEMSNNDDHKLEQNMYKSLSESDKKTYIAMDSIEKLKYFNTYYKK